MMLGTLGAGVGAGLALKGSGRLPVAIMGDGDFLMGNTALWTTAHYQIPCLMIVSNNRSFYSDEREQERVARQRGRPLENRWIGQRIDDPRVDLTAMARAQGFDAAEPVSTSEALERALKRGAEVVASGGRYFIDAVITPGYADSGPDQRASMKKG